LKAQVNRLFTTSRSSAGSRTIKGLLSEEGVVVGRFKVRRLMSELAREFTVDRPNQAWCGDITYVYYGVVSGGAIWRLC
jgi:putative transposase